MPHYNGTSALYFVYTGKGSLDFIVTEIEQDIYDEDGDYVDTDDLMIATIQSAGGVDDFLRVLYSQMIFWHKS